MTPSPLTSTLRTKSLLVLCFCLAAASCSGGGEESHGVDDGDGGGSGGSSGSGQGGGGSAGTIGGSSGAATIGGSTGIGGSIGVGGASGSGGTGEQCASQKAGTNLLPVRLAFAFDVSGSMGQGDYPWHDASLKWEPVVAATRAFFEDAASAGLEASLTAFPVAASEEKCVDGSYEAPIVPMTPLPSPAFGAALDGIRAGSWRGGTPTLHVVNGVLSYIEATRATDPARYVFVLVTDGYPQGCSDNTIQSVVDAVGAVSADIPTYVIGVANPPLTDDDGMMAPETVMNLSAVAVAGGTERAYIIDTGNPAQTQMAFSAAVNEIRGTSISCELRIPPIPDGRQFERDKVAVTYTSGGATIDLTYDSTCAAPNSWHYDDPLAPTQIVLCDSTCDTVQAAADATLDVTFTCNSVIDPR
ncbi:MAG TPA: vWA domain-containing protein [Polyangiaceae bacterium]